MNIEFGIPDLDHLFGKPVEDPTAKRGISMEEGESISVCIVGADGTGKSILALHLAAHYASEHGEADDARVIYFSEDLGFRRAKVVYENFGLASPTARRKSLGINRGGFTGENAPLFLCKPNGTSLILPQPGCVGFVDLKENTSGDDWMLVLESVAKITPRENGILDCVIVDNIDALQLVNAGVDQFGEDRTRWSRLDQLTNLAKGKCHLVLLSAEPGRGLIQDEQYAVDYVLHLRTEESKEGYVRKTMEVEKARGQANVGGPHIFVTRNGKGTTTGYQPNVDFKDTPINTGASERPLSYIRIFHSLDLEYSKYTEHKYEGYVPGTGKPVKFCELEGLVQLLPKNAICGGKVAAIVGPRETFKSDLIFSLEAGNLRATVMSSDNDPTWDLARDQAKTLSQAEKASALPEDLAGLYKKYRDTTDDLLKGSSSPIVVHLTTDDVDSWQVAYHIRRWISNKTQKRFEAKYGPLEQMKKQALATIEARVICRRLDVRANSPSLLWSLIRDNVEAGINRSLGKTGLELRATERLNAGQVLVTIGDWPQIQERQPEVAADTKFLPLLIFYLKRQGVTTVIRESRTESSALPAVYQSLSQLAQDSDQTIYTWRVLGDTRIAITTAPQRTYEGRTLVRELRVEADRPGRVRTDSSLERYQGFESGDPKPVKLHLKLLGQTPDQRAYAHRVGILLNELAKGEEEGSPLVEATEELEYERLRDVTSLMGDRRLSHTQVVMLDEFWNDQHSLQSLTDYLKEKSDNNALKGFFKSKQRKSDFSNYPNNSTPEHRDKALQQEDEYRIPYTWDFGFILARPDVWRGAYNHTVPSTDRRMEQAEDVSVGSFCSVMELTELLRFAKRANKGEEYQPDEFRNGKYQLYNRSVNGLRIDRVNKRNPHYDMLGWRIFLEACSIGARQVNNVDLRPFDIDLTAREALAATVMEIWFSEILSISSRTSRRGQTPIESDDPEIRALDEVVEPVRSLTLNSTADDVSLRELLENEGAVLALYFTLQLLAEVFDLDMLEPSDGGFDIAPRRSLPAVSVRHWYATAVRSVKEDDVPAYIAIRLPGSFSTRGDWHLGVVKGSRSIRLSHDVMDILSSPTANFERLQHGVGLPTRSMPEPDYIRTALALHPRPTALPSCSYGNLRSLGGGSSDPDFHWLFRSHIRNYRFHATPFRKWIFRTLRRWVENRQRSMGDWKNAFKMYDEVFFPQEISREIASGNSHYIGYRSWKLEELPGYSGLKDSARILSSLLKDAAPD